MSLINDALKQAKQAPPRSAPNLTLLQPAAGPVASGGAWLIPALVIALIVAAIFLVGRASGQRTVRSVQTALPPVAVAVTSVSPKPSASSASAAPAVSKAPVTPPPAEPAPSLPLDPPVMPAPVTPVLQGIFYSPTAPTAIVDGKTVRPGSQLREYRVREITKSTVTLVGPDNQEIQIGMGR